MDQNTSVDSHTWRKLTLKLCQISWACFRPSELPPVGSQIPVPWITQSLLSWSPVCALLLSFLSLPSGSWSPLFHGHYSQGCLGLSHSQTKLPCFWIAKPVVHQPCWLLQDQYHKKLYPTPSTNLLDHLCPTMLAFQQMSEKLKSPTRTRVKLLQVI